MTILPILTDPDPRLRQLAAEIKTFDENLLHLVEDMFETMHQARGVGLAAPQLGILSQLVVMQFKRKKMVLVNPQIINGSGNVEDEEACLSVPNRAGQVARLEKITVQAQNIKGESITIKEKGYFARIIQHEMDHLKGTLFIDKMLYEIAVDAEEEKT